jgi:TonB family protein
LIACASSVQRRLAGDVLVRFPHQAEIVVDTETHTRNPLRSAAPMEYPRPVSGRYDEAEPVVAFVIDTAGRVEGPSISFVQSASQPFRMTVCRFLRGARYVPQPTSERPVRTLVVQPFIFSRQVGALRSGLMVDDWNRRVATSSRDDLFAYLTGLPHCQ